MKLYNYVYLITNNINGKIYVGKHSTDNLNDCYMGSGKILKLAYNKYGVENFTKKILAFADTEEKLNWFERFYIKKYHCRDKSIGYNLTDGGDGTLGLPSPMKGKFGVESSMYGKHHSEETKKKISTSNKGKTIGRTVWNKGKHHSEETKKKISDARKGVPTWTGLHHTEETKKKISETKKGTTACNKGKPMTEEQKLKISNTLKNKSKKTL